MVFSRALHLNPGACCLLFAALAVASLQDDRISNRIQYCLTYYGYVSALLDPYGVHFTYAPGATLQVCPPVRSDFEGYENLALDVALSFHPSDNGCNAINSLLLSDILITNKPVQWPYMSGTVEPAVLTEDSTDSVLSWKIEGSEKSLYENPRGPSARGVNFSCSEIRKDSLYWYWDDEDWDCLESQIIKWNPHAKNLQYTIHLDPSWTRMTIWTQGEDFGSISTGKPSPVLDISFIGSRRVPKVTDDSFWSNFPGSYEAEKERFSDEIDILSDEAGMPVFANISLGECRPF
ncbi:hypothetical protein MGYG_08856 [Nannizzia gypsea CBS 118893]|uniref:Uncharacterized protein n=1 Tax=Arthroderma gypseum (strain ATCC MYA-4604 / CBS 118893) TaxID=535722 RepID=E4V765_ARTGP|nr:hypothetical protein MGYG_08856 [Nannizzia gypsea CBS 118893]EFQ96931.1 hypothetical protein MGYG_08856 [Nannizzia gypsea CBS 118893]